MPNNYSYRFSNKKPLKPGHNDDRGPQLESNSPAKSEPPDPPRRIMPPPPPPRPPQWWRLADLFGRKS